MAQKAKDVNYVVLVSTIRINLFVNSIIIIVHTLYISRKQCIFPKFLQIYVQRHSFYKLIL